MQEIATPWTRPRAISQRFDFKNTGSSVDLTKEGRPSHHDQVDSIRR